MTNPSPNSQSVISLQGVSKRFVKTVALNDVSLDIPSGVVFALLGENGAGKTTMIRILTGFLKPDSGNATVLGTFLRARQVWRFAARLAMCPTRRRCTSG